MKTSHKRNVHTPSSSKLVIISILKGEMFLPYPFNNEIVFFCVVVTRTRTWGPCRIFRPYYSLYAFAFCTKKSSLPFFARFSGVFSVETPQVPLNKFFPIVIKNEKSFLRPARSWKLVICRRVPSCRVISLLVELKVLSCFVMGNLCAMEMNLVTRWHESW